MKRSFTLIPVKHVAKVTGKTFVIPYMAEFHKKYDNWSDAISMLMASPDGSALHVDGTEPGDIATYRMVNGEVEIFSIDGSSEINMAILGGFDSIKPITEEIDGIITTITPKKIWDTLQESLAVKLKLQFMIEREAS